jgi:hypothetical protein
MPHVNILGFSTLLPQPYSAGHVVTQAEADALNRLLVRGLSKALHRVLLDALAPHGARVMGQVGDAVRDATAARAAVFISEYVEGFANGHDRLRAIDVEARRIAALAVETDLYRQGRALREVPAVELDAMVSALAASPRVREEAQRRVDDLAQIARSAHADLAAQSLFEGAD